MPSRVALYLRVSSDAQTHENQLVQLREFCDRQGYVIQAEYVDYESGRRGKAERASFARLFKDAAARRFDVVLFWSLDRFSREGIRKTILYLQQFEAMGVRFKSYTEPVLDTGNELVSHILLGVLSYFAELEGKRISERTRAGLARVRTQGKTLTSRWLRSLERHSGRNAGEGLFEEADGPGVGLVVDYREEVPPPDGSR